MPLASSSSQMSASRSLYVDSPARFSSSSVTPRVGVDLVEVGLRHADQPVPVLERLGVARLELDDPGTRPDVEIACAAVRFGLLGGIELHPRALVEGVGVGDEQLRLGRVLPHLEEVLDEHAEGRAPVPDVVLPDDVVAQVLERAGEGVADDRGAEVADVHLLGDVGRGVVDRDVLPLLERARQPARRPRHRCSSEAIHASAKRQVDEARTAHLDRLARCRRGRGRRRSWPRPRAAARRPSWPGRARR